MNTSSVPSPDASSPDRVWIFDLDNTLYPRALHLFEQIDRRMTAFIAAELRVDAAEADRLRRLYWEEYGATLIGMVKRHGTDPGRFLDACHRIDYSSVTPCARLARAIAALPGRRVIHTNGPRAHAVRVLAARGLAELFPDIVAIEDMGYRGKPTAEAFGVMLDRTGLQPERAVMVEDTPANLAEPHRLGMVTVLVECPTRPTHRKAPHIHHRTLDLAAFLEGYGPQPDGLAD